MKRKWAASEALTIGRGGVLWVHMATGISKNTIRKGIEETNVSLPCGENDDKVSTTRIRAIGGGRKQLIESDPSLLVDLHMVMDPITSGDPMNILKYTSHSTYNISKELNLRGHSVSPDTVGRLLKKENYSLQATAKTIEGGYDPNRDSQFNFINSMISIFTRLHQPIISVDAKKKELVGNFANKGKEWQKKGEPINVHVYDFLDLGDGKATPYGIFDINYNEGFVNVGMSHDTAIFATESIKKWWLNIGAIRYNNSASKLLILADGGGSNSSRNRSWKLYIQNFANIIKMPIYICHYPPGTSKYNKIEHRMFSYISINWRGRPLTTFRIIVNLIASTTTNNGLKIHAELDSNIYEIGKKVSDADFDNINIKYSNINPKYNYCIRPQ
jgi:hypothetical protein